MLVDGNIAHDLILDASGYAGNPLLRPVGMKVILTEWQVQEYIRCATDPIYFCENYIKIVSLDEGIIPFKPYDYQRKIIKTCTDERFVIILSARQSGKSVTMSSWAVWNVLFTQNYSIAFMANKMEQSQVLLASAKMAYENLPKWMQQGVVTWNKRSIELENGSTMFCSATSGSALRGRALNCVGGETLVTVIDDDGGIYHSTVEKLANSSNTKYLADAVADRSRRMEPKFHFVYKTTNKCNGKFYIGYHSTDDMDDGYLGSGTVLKRAVEKYGPDNFYRIVLKHFGSREEALAYEREIVNEDAIRDPNCYNLCFGGSGGGLPGYTNPAYGKCYVGYKCTYKGSAFDAIAHAIRYARSLGDSRTMRVMTADGDFKFVDPDRQAEYFAWASSVHERRSAASMAHNKSRLLGPGKHTLDEMYGTERANEIKEVMKNGISRRTPDSWKGKPWSEDRKAKIRGKKSPWTILTNHNPVKIARAAATHRGMKRSAVARANMSAAARRSFDDGRVQHNKNTVSAYSADDRKVITVKTVADIPDGYVRGTGMHDYHNGTIGKRFYVWDTVPEGWIRGRVLKCKS